MSGKIVMIGSMKGGVSKTVTTFNLAYSLSKLGKKVLAVDFDSQANLSTCLGVENVTAVPVTIGNLMLAQIEEEELPERSEYIQTRNGVDYISSSMVLSAVDAKLRLEMGSEKMLSDILETLRDSYDYILIDTSPSLGALTINAMSAADEVLITVNPQLLAMMGLQDFLKTVKKIKNRINSRLSVAGILLTMCDSRTNLCKVITEEVTETFEGQIKIFESKLLHNIGTIFICAVSHFLIEVIQVICRIGWMLSECGKHFEFTKAVCIGTLFCIRAGFIFNIRTELCRWWTV